MSHPHFHSDGNRPGTSEKEKILSDISHDLNTPLSVIIGFTQLLLEEVPGPINDSQQQCLNDILNSARRLTCQIENLLEQTRKETNVVTAAICKKPNRTMIE